MHSSSQVWMWELDYKESWAPKNWCFWTIVLEKTLESPLDCKEIQLVNPKGNQSWLFIGRTDAEAEAPILWPPDVKNWPIGKDPDAGKDWRQEEKGTTENEMVVWHHWLDGHEFEQALGVGEGQGSLACFSPWDGEESDVTERLNCTELDWGVQKFIRTQDMSFGVYTCHNHFFFCQKIFLRILFVKKEKGNIRAIPGVSSQSEATNIWKVYYCKCFKCWAKSLQSCPTLCNPVDCSLPGSSVHGILWARILEWIAISSSVGSSRPSDWTPCSLPPAPPGKR